MRLLCDHSVDRRFIDTFRRTDWITMTTVAEELSPDADDEIISEYAAQHNWIVFTEDDDFTGHNHDRGLVRYIHRNRPSPSDVLNALEVVADAYSDQRNIDVIVPGGWI